MGAAIFTLTMGAILVYSALKGEGLVDVFKGVTGNPLDPSGGHLSSDQTQVLGGDPTTSGQGILNTVPGSGASAGEGHGVSGSATHVYSGPNAALLDQLEYAAVHQFGLTITSRNRSAQLIGHADYHNANRAFDASGLPTRMAAYARWATQNYGSSLLECFYAPAKITWKNGRNMYPAVYDLPTHVHTAA